MNYLGILVAFIALQALGFVWYHEGFLGTPWLEDVGLDPDNLGAPHPMVWVTMSVATVFKVALLEIMLRAMKIEKLTNALFWGFVLGLGLLALTLASHHGFAMRPVRQIYIEGSQEVIGYMLAAAILTLWPNRSSDVR